MHILHIALETFPADKENLFNSQKLLELVIIPFIP